MLRVFAGRYALRHLALTNSLGDSLCPENYQSRNRRESRSQFLAVQYERRNLYILRGQVRSLIILLNTHILHTLALRSEVRIGSQVVQLRRQKNYSPNMESSIWNFMSSEAVDVGTSNLGRNSSGLSSSLSEQCLASLRKVIFKERK